MRGGSGRIYGDRIPRVRPAAAIGPLPLGPRPPDLGRQRAVHAREGDEHALRRVVDVDQAAVVGAAVGAADVQLAGEARVARRDLAGLVALVQALAVEDDRVRVVRAHAPHVTAAHRERLAEAGE
jgi:hypothetical protein